MSLSADHFLLAVIQWHPHFSGVWCGVIIFAAAAWLYFLHQRMLRRVSQNRARWLLLPKILTLLALLFVLFDPVSAVQQNEATKGKLLVLVDSSTSMDVADDYRQPRVTRARNIVASWKGALPRDVSVDELEFDTTIHPPGEKSASAGRGTDLGGCLLALSERNDLASYLGVALLTDGGDEVLENPALPKLPLYVVGVGTDPATWNDVAIVGADCPATAEKDVDFEISADLQARAGHGGDFASRLAQVHVVLEHATSTNAWEKISGQTVDLSNLHRLVHLPVKSSDVGIQRYRVSVEPVAGELSALNNARIVTVNVQKKSLHVLFFAEELGQEFKVLRNELAHDPGIAFTALFRTTASRYMLQGDRQPGDEALADGFPATKKGLEPYDAIVLGSFPASDFSARQMQALAQFCENGGTVIFLGGDASFGRGGYAGTPLAALFPWRISDREPEQAHGIFPVRVPPMGTGNPILAGVEEIVARSSVALDAVNPTNGLLVTRSAGALPANPFLPTNVPITLSVPARRIIGWNADVDNLVAQLQASPVRSTQAVENLMLVPMGAAHLRISAFPTIGTGTNAHDWVATPPFWAATSASYVHDDITALNDGIEAAASSDASIPRFTWYNHQGTTEWAEYELATFSWLRREVAYL